MKANETVFEQLIQGNGSWCDHPCGTGSTLTNTQAVRDHLPQLFSKYSITSMLDVPCGDHSWMSSVEFPQGFKYTGADIVGSMINANSKSYPQHHWLYLDAVNEPLPTVDLVFVRDFFIHISDNCILKFLNNVINSGSKYVLISNYKDVTVNHKRSSIDGSMRSYNLTLAPFNLPQPLEVITETYDTNSRSMALWRVADITHSREHT